MKKILILCLAITLLTFSACGISDTQAAPSASPTGTPAATPVPDFSGTDFTGSWYVYEIIDSTGASLSDGEKEALGAGFTLEMLPGGAYFVYDEDGEALGQGEYSVTQNSLALTAADGQTVYEIVDGDTLRITQSDNSVTVMKRITETCADDSETADADTDAGDDASSE